MFEHGFDHLTPPTPPHFGNVQKANVLLQHASRASPIIVATYMKNYLFPGIEVTLDNLPYNGVILAVTDAGTKQKELEKLIRKKSEEKNVKIFFAFSPICRAQCETSMPVYNRLSDGRMFNQTDFDRESFFKSVLYTVCKQ